MNRLTLLIAAGLLSATAAFAQVRVASVDMERVYREHFKTQEFQRQLTNGQTEVQAKVQSLQEEGRALLTQLQALIEQINNTALAEAAREQARTDARRVNEQVEQKREELARFVQQSNQLVQERAVNHRMTLMDEIKAAVEEVARARNAEIAIDTSGRASNGSSSLLWAARSEDITNAVIERVNRDRPANVPAPAAVPAPTVTPASDQPIRLPGT